MTNNLGVFIVLAGASSSGKDTIKHRLLEKYPHMAKVITTTTRLPRRGEVNGEDMNFISEQEFKKMQQDDEFLETVEYAGKLYGTTKSAIIDHLNQDLIWRIDPSRAARVRELIKSSFDPQTARSLLDKVIVFYIFVPAETTRHRLTERGLEADEVERRIEQDKTFWEQYHNQYDYVIENPQGKLEQTLDTIVKILENKKA